MNTNLNQLLKDLEQSRLCQDPYLPLGVYFMLYPTFFTSPVFSGNFLYTNRYFSHRAVPLCIRGRNSSFSDKSGEVSKDTLYPFGDAFLFSNDKSFHLFIFSE